MGATTRMMELSTAGLQAFADRIAATRVSEVFREQLWIVPTSQSIHIVAVSLLFASVLVASLRILGVSRSDRLLSVVVDKSAKVIYVALGALLLTGSVQMLAEPVRQLLTPAFWYKMVLVVVGLMLTYLLAKRVHRDPGIWDLRASRPAWSPLYALLMVATWSAVIVCGRFIGYTHH